MADRYYVRKFDNSTDLASYLNFTNTNPTDYGTGYVTGNVLTAVTQNNYDDWTDIDGGGTDISGVLHVSGGTNAQQYATITSVPTASTLGATISNIGSSSSPVNYRIYAADPKFTGTIQELRVGANGEVVMVWTAAGKLHF